MNSTRLTADARRALRNLAASLADAPRLRAAADTLAQGAARVLHVSAAVERRGPEGVAVFAGIPAAGAGAPARVPSWEDPDDLDTALLAQQEFPLGTHGGAEWVLVLTGRWDEPRAQAFFVEFARLAAVALKAPALREVAARSDNVIASAYMFTRRLSRLHGSDPLPQFIVDGLAMAARADLASLATWDADAAHLRIVATHGYPAVLVEHVRVPPGQGVLGRVFEARSPMLVTNLDQVPGLHSRRPRYRTPSFLAVPLLADGDVLGVVCLADRADGRAFERADLTAARALAAPAALGLLNDRLAREARALAHAATVDPLTGLFNRRYFQTRLEEEMERSRRYKLDLALLIVDIDNFKHLNDQLGHLAGDYLLRQVSDVLRRSVRVFDVCTRYGGEEFAILMPGSALENGLLVAERIRQRVEAASREAGPLPAHMRVTVSLGLTVLAEDGSPQEFIARADRALYRAKAEGKNRVRYES